MEPRDKVAVDRDDVVHHALVTKRGALGVDRKEVGRGDPGEDDVA